MRDSGGSRARLGAAPDMATGASEYTQLAADDFAEELGNSFEATETQPSPRTAVLDLSTEVAEQTLVAELRGSHPAAKIDGRVGLNGGTAVAQEAMHTHDDPQESTGSALAADDRSDRLRGNSTSIQAALGVIKREVHLQMKDQMGGLGKLRGVTADSVDTIRDQGVAITASSKNFAERSWECLSTDLPGYPRRFCTWVTKPVTISDETSRLDWTKLFTLHLLSYFIPPLVFCTCTHKIPPGSRQAVDQSSEFLKRVVWLSVSIAIPALWYLGSLPTLVSSEAFMNVCLYFFLALMKSYEEASLRKPREEERSTKIRAGTKRHESLDKFSDFVGACIPSAPLHTL